VTDGPSGPGGAGAHREQAERPFDVGLQPERTALAWSRTGLVFLVGALLAARLLLEVVGTWVLIPVAPVVLIAIGVSVAGSRRYRDQHRRLTSGAGDRIALPDGALPALVSALTAVCGIASLAVVLHLALR